MGSIKRQLESYGSDDDDRPLYDPEDLQEALTLTSEQMQRAREEALYVLKTNSAEEAFKIFTQGLKYSVEAPVVPAGEGGGVDRSVVRPPAETAAATAGNGGIAGGARAQTQTTTAPPPQN